MMIDSIPCSTIVFTICTITLNNDHDLIRTLDSIDSQTLKPHFVVVKDGALRPRPSFLDKYDLNIHYHQSLDRGIYDAMNQAIYFSPDSYLLFLNSGDILHSTLSLNLLFTKITQYTDSPDIIFTGWSHQNSGAIFAPMLNPLYFSHQAVIYRKSLHFQHGTYVDAHNFHSSDYLFFAILCASNHKIIFLPSMITSSIDPFGTSNSAKTRLYVSCIRCLFGQEHRSSLAIISLLHPLYCHIRSWIFNLLSFFRGYI